MAELTRSVCTRIPSIKVSMPGHYSDSCGLSIEFEITGGEVNDCSAALQLIAQLPDAKRL